MTRPPKAKQAVLAAARRIVSEKGAGALTFDELATESGVTRGGITYHFPTKDALLHALIEHDLEQWIELEERLRPADAEESTAELITHIRSHTNRDLEKRRFVSGMLSAAMHQPTLLDPIRDHLVERHARHDWSDAELDRHILRLASEGLFWSELFDCYRLPEEVRARLVTRLEALALEWSGNAHQPEPE